MGGGLWWFERRRGRGNLGKNLQPRSSSEGRNGDPQSKGWGKKEKKEP